MRTQDSHSEGTGDGRWNNATMAGGADRVVVQELEVLAKQEKVAAEQEMLRATAEKNTKPKKAKENILIGWGKG